MFLLVPAHLGKIVVVVVVINIVVYCDIEL